MKQLPHTLAAKVGKLIPRLASEHDGEVVATARAIGRTLTGAGYDFNDAAERFTGRNLPEPAFDPTPQEPKPTPRGWPSYGWREAWAQRAKPTLSTNARLHLCEQSPDALSAWEREFVASLRRRVSSGLTLSAKQAAILSDIVKKVIA